LEQISQKPAVQPGEPWLLHFFDQVRFYPVSEQELDEQREAFREGRAQIRIEDSEFDFADYRRFLAENAEDINAFQQRQQQAFSHEVTRWQAEEGEAEAQLLPPQTDEEEVDGDLVSADLNGSVWKILVEPGAEGRSRSTADRGRGDENGAGGHRAARRDHQAHQLPAGATGGAGRCAAVAGTRQLTLNHSRRGALCRAHGEACDANHQ
jgi:biotin carboxyl carrier protein